MSDTSQQLDRPPGRSVLYALGRLEAQNDEQRREIASLPGRIAEVFTPRLVAIEQTLTDHGRRISLTERKVWIGMGVVTTITTLITVWETIHH